MDIRKTLETQLNKPSYIVKIFDKTQNLRLKKNSALMRYAYSLNDILTEFGSFESLINNLKEKGYTQTTFTFQRTYNAPHKTTYHTMLETNVNLKNSPSNFTVSQVDQNHQQNMSIPDFLGNPLANQNINFLGAMVESERSGDYKKRISELEETIKDYRSEVRLLKEENHTLKLKDATSEERTELKIQTEILNKKSVFESDGFQKIAEGLGGILPHLPAMLNKAAPVAQLGGVPENLSPLQIKVIDKIKTANDADVAFCLFVLENMSEDLVNVLNNYISSKS